MKDQHRRINAIASYPLWIDSEFFTFEIQRSTFIIYVNIQIILRRMGQRQKRCHIGQNVYEIGLIYVLQFIYHMSLKDFQFLGKLGEGAYSSVYKAKRLIDNEIYAIKKVKLNNLNEREKENALNEVRILASIHHPNIINYKESFIEQSTNFLYMVMEFADNGDLYEKISLHSKNNTKFTEEEIWSITIQITRGLKALHELKILHRDLKSANVFMFSNGAVKLGDMNVSKMSKSMCKTQTGTPYYASPEVWKDLPYDKKSDIWSLGCVIYEAIALKPPFRANDMEGLYKKVTRGFYPRIPPEYSEQLTIILKMLLEVTPHLRSTCDRILQLPIVLKHIPCLPEHLQELDEKTQNKLLRTIKLTLDSKEKLSILMPKPRYVSTIDFTDKLNSRSSIEEVQDKDFHHISLKKQLYEKDRLPKIEDHKKRQKMYSEVGNRYEKDERSMVNRLIEPIRGEQSERLYGKRHKEKIDLNSDRKLPLILQGRLKSLSPQTIKKILKKEKQKQRVYSIIGRN